MGINHGFAPIYSYDAEPIKYNMDSFKRIWNGWNYYRDAPQEYFDLMEQLQVGGSTRTKNGEDIDQVFKYAKRLELRTHILFCDDGFLRIQIGYDFERNRKYPVEVVEKAMYWVMNAISVFRKFELI